MQEGQGLGLGWATEARRSGSAILWFPQPSASSPGGGERWAGGRQPRESGLHRRSGGELGGRPRGWCRAGRGEEVSRLLTTAPLGPPPPGSSAGSSCAMHPVAQRMPSSWTTCAPLFCSTCGGNCPGMSWTLPGPRHRLPCVRSVAFPADLGTTKALSMGRGHPNNLVAREGSGGLPRGGELELGHGERALLRERTQE